MLAKFRREGESIGRNFPYRFHDYKMVELHGESYHGKNIAPNGNCWLYTSWVAYFHMLNQCKNGYDDLPKLLTDLRNEVAGFKAPYKK